MEIAGKSAVVSGGGSGIGRATCVALAQAGAKVVVADIDERGGAETVDHCGAAGGIAVFRHCDVTHTEDVASAFACAFEHFGSFDIVHNNAGIGGEDLFEDELEAWARVVDINLTAVIDATRIAVREMRRGRGGVIINTASMGGLLPMPTAPVYAATKAGVINFSRSLAYLALEHNIRVNAICPSYVDTPLVRRDGGQERVDEMTKQMGGILRPEDIAAGVIELIEDDSRAGSVMRVTVQKGRDYAREIRA
jgi:NAD(P)-dependent dehydrogenase (short-subunit alcohol dehydrogenase family)